MIHESSATPFPGLFPGRPRQHAAGRARPLRSGNGRTRLSSRPPLPIPQQLLQSIRRCSREAGLTAPNVWGAVDHKRYIIEAKGSGLAFFDYDNDGWLDIYLTNGTRLDANWPRRQGAHFASLQKQSRRHVHRRHRKIRPRPHRLADRRLRRRLRQRRLGRSVLLLLGTQHSVSQQRRRNFHRRHSQGRGLRRTDSAGARAAPFSTTTATATSIFSSATTSNSIRRKTPAADDPPSASGKGSR